MIRRPWLSFLVISAFIAVAGMIVPKHLDASIKLSADKLHSASEQSEIVISGTNNLAKPAIIVLRVDDKAAPSYFDRANIERKVPTGPFKFRIPIALLKTPKGRRLDRANINNVMVFSAPDDTKVVISSISIEQAPKLSDLHDDVIALDFGPENAPVFPGFTGVAPNASILQGPHQTAKSRPGADILISDGISGIERITFAVPAGQWDLTLWTEDPGEWEYLPHFLERRVKVNGRTIHHERRQPKDWVKEVYLRGRGREWQPGESAWDSYGKHRGDPLRATVDVTDGRITIELAGDQLSATHVSGLLLVPAKSPRIRAAVERQRKTRFNETWRTLAVDHEKSATRNEPLSVITPKVTAAPGTLAFVRATVSATTRFSFKSMDIEAPSHGTTTLPVTTFGGHWRLTRPDASSTLLIPDDRHLRGDVSAMTIGPILPRNITLAITVSSKTPPGLYTGAIAFAGMKSAYEIEVLDVTLPPAGAAIGVYFDHSPLHVWFNTNPRPASRCALQTLRWLGLTSVAPPLETPQSRAGRKKLEQDLSLAQASGIDGPYLAYTPLKRLLTKANWRNELSDLMERLDDRQDQIIWSAADEVSNLGGDHAALREHLGDIRSVAPPIRLAGHLNAPRDRSIVDAFDLVLINSGFGLDPRAISTARRKAKSVYLYNMESPRLASGFYLWRMGVDGYLQWHANMATADPFDPTDGREADISWLYPTAEPCPVVPDLDRSLIEMAEGIIDLRWLRWLDLKALHNANAATLRDAIRRAINGHWNNSKALKFKHLNSIRLQIIEMARTLQ